jgi:hypothetical protein
MLVEVLVKVLVEDMQNSRIGGAARRGSRVWYLLSPNVTKIKRTTFKFRARYIAKGAVEDVAPSQLPRILFSFTDFA